MPVAHDATQHRTEEEALVCTTNCTRVARLLSLLFLDTPRIADAAFYFLTLTLVASVPLPVCMRPLAAGMPNRELIPHAHHSRLTPIRGPGGCTPDENTQMAGVRSQEGPFLSYC